MVQISCPFYLSSSITYSNVFPPRLNFHCYRKAESTGPCVEPRGPAMDGVFPRQLGARRGHHTWRVPGGGPSHKAPRRRRDRLETSSPRSDILTCELACSQGRILLPSTAARSRSLGLPPKTVAERSCGTPACLGGKGGIAVFCLLVINREGREEGRIFFPSFSVLVSEKKPQHAVPAGCAGSFAVGIAVCGKGTAAWLRGCVL